MANEYNHNFQDQIAAQQRAVDSKYNQYNESRNSANNYEQAYQNAMNNQTSYNDMSDAAENHYGVNDAKNTYQDSLRAIAATNQAMSALPSTVNANSNVVLNQAQRNAALGNQMSKYQNTLASWQQQNATDQSALNIALQQAAQRAAMNYQQQNDNLNRQQADWQTMLNQANADYQLGLSEKNILRDIYNSMYQDEYQHMDDDYKRWYAGLQDKWKQQEIAAQKYAADSAMRVQKYIQQKQDERDAAAAAQAKADLEARKRAAAAAKASSNAKNTYATEYKAKNFGDWLSTGGIIGDIFEHGLNFFGGGNVGSYGRYGEGKGTKGSFW